MSQEVPQKKQPNYMESAAMKKMMNIAGKLYADSPQLFDKNKEQSYLLSKVGKNMSAAPTSGGTGALPPINSPSPAAVTEKTPKYIHMEYEELHREWENELKRSEELKKEKQERLNRYIKKEQEYREKIEEYTKKIKPMDGTVVTRSDMANLESDHQKILKRIDSIQKKTSHVLIEQENDIIMFYNEKINELTKQFKEENTRQKERHASFKKKEEKLMSELEWIKKIAHKIDIENYYLVKRYTELKVENETQKKDRDLLLTEDAYQKERSKHLEAKLTEYKNLLQKLIKDKDLELDIDGDVLTESRMLEELKKKGGKRGESEARSLIVEDEGKRNPEKEVEERIGKLKREINEEREKILMIKHRYTGKLEEKNEMEKLMRACINDYKDELWNIKTNMRKQEQAHQMQDALKHTVKDILDKEKKLSLLYDKLFHIKPLLKDVSA